MLGKRWILRFLTLGLCASVCFSQTRPVPRAQLPKVSRPAYLQKLKAFEETQFVTKALLRNGLTLLVHEFHSQPVVNISTYVQAGYGDEPADAIGISDLLEHMLFKRTSDKGAGVIAREARAMGAVWTTSTGYDYASYDVVVPSAQWKRALGVQADAWLNPIFDAEDLKREIDATQCRADQEIINPDQRAYGELLGLGFKQRMAGRWRLDSPDRLQGISGGRLLDYYKATCTPGRTILVVCGDVLAPEVVSEVVRLYEKAGAGGSKPASQPGERARPGFQYHGIQGRVSFPQVLLGFQTAPIASPDYPALQVLTAILGLGEGSALSNRLRSEKKVILRGTAHLVAHQDLGYLAIQMEVDPKDIDRCEIAALTELEVLRRQEPDKIEMQRALAQLERQYWSRMQTVTGRAHALAQFESLGGWRRMNEYLPRLRRVNPADVCRVAKKYLDLDSCSLLEYLPEGSEPRNLTAEAILKTLRGLLEPSTRQLLGEREREAVPAMDIPSAESSFRFSEVRSMFQKASILRGPELFIREDHTAPMIYAGFFFPGGKLLEKDDNSGITSLMLHAMLRGTRERGAAQLHRQLELYGAEVLPVVDDDYFGIFFSVLSKNVEPALELLAEIVKSPKFDKDEIDRQKQLQLAAIRTEKQSGPEPAWRLLDRALFSSHPYALPAGGSEASVAALNDQAVVEWYRQNVDRRKPVVAIIGDTKGTSLASYFVEYFSGSRFLDTKLPEDFPKSVQQRATIEAKGGQRRSMVLYGLQAPPAGDEDWYVLKVLEHYLTGSGGLLYDGIRDRQGIACDISLRYEARARGGSIVVCAQTDVSDEDKVIKAIEEELGRAVESPITYRDYRASLNSAVGKYRIEQQERAVEIATMVRNVLSGKMMEAIHDDVARLQEVKQDDLAEVARRVFKLNGSVVVRLHGRQP